MFDRVLNMPQVLNMPGFGIYLSPQYPRVLNVSGSQYAKFTVSWISLNNSWVYLIILEYVWICLSIPKYAWVCLDLPEWLFCLPCPHCNPLYAWMCGCLFLQSLCMKEHWDCFLEESIFDIFLFTSKISNLLLPFGAKGA